jgi:cyclohexyl-isocyanide hydratase
MTRIAIPLYPGVDLLDVAGPYEMLNWAGFEIDLLAEQSGPIACRGGAPLFEVSKTFEGAGQYDILWVPGGDPASLVCLMHQSPRTYLDFVAGQSQGAAMTCSVCEGALLLAAAGLLNGYKATTHWAFIPCLSAWPKVKVARGHPRFVHDRNRLTGGGISAGLDEALKLIELFMGEEKARETQQTTQYYPRPPVRSRLPKAQGCPLPAVDQIDCAVQIGRPKPV